MEKNIFIGALRIIIFITALIILTALIFMGSEMALMQLVLIVAVAGGISVLMAWRMAKITARPVAEAARQLKKIAAQNIGFEKADTKKDTEQLTKGVSSLALLLEKTVDSLNDTNSSLKAMLKAIPCAVIAVDRSKKIIMVNNIARKFFGMDEGSEGRYFIECVRSASMENMINTAIGTEKGVEDENEVVSLAGRLIYKINVAPIKKMDIVTGAVLMAQDITEIKHLEIMRRDFAANVSHELKTPLTVISGFLETIKTEKDLSEQTRERFLDIVSLETERLSRLIDDILSLSEIETCNLSHFENVNVDGCIQRSIELLHTKAEEKNIRLDSYLDLGQNTVLGSLGRVSQMAINLIDNAIKYTPNGGRVAVHTNRTGNNCVITVEDNGIGISIDDQRRLFERFYRADKSRSKELGGTGLGLSIVKHIVSSMDGSVTVESAPGNGSVFTVTLPLAK